MTESPYWTDSCTRQKNVTLVRIQRKNARKTVEPSGKRRRLSVTGKMPVG